MEKAKYYFQQSLDMRKEFYGLEHPEVAASLAHMLLEKKYMVKNTLVLQTL